MDEWASSSTYEDRVAHLGGAAGGLNNDNNLVFSGPDATVFDDRMIDHLNGASDRDWFFAFASDTIHGKHPSETVNN
jgi:hypothetical protein